MPIQVDQERLAEVFRLKVAGLSTEEIARELTTRAIMRYPADEAQVRRDCDAVDRIMREYGDPDKARTAIVLDLDRLFAMILQDLNTTFNWSSRPAARAEFYKQGAQILMQKALLYGLNSENINLSRSSQLTLMVQQLRQLDATQLESEATYLPEPESDDLSFAVTPTARLLVASDSGHGR